MSQSSHTHLLSTNLNSIVWCSLAWCRMLSDCVVCRCCLRNFSVSFQCLIRLAVTYILLQERRTRTSSISSDSSLPAELRPNQKWFIGGSESQPTAARDRNVTRARCLAAHVLGRSSTAFFESPTIMRRLVQRSQVRSPSR